VLREKIDAMVSGLIVLLYYAMTGPNTDVWMLHCGRLLFVVFLWWFGKLVGVMVPSMYFEIPLLDAVSLSLFMNSKGIVEVITFFLSNKVITRPWARSAQGRKHQIQPLTTKLIDTFWVWIIAVDRYARSASWCSRPWRSQRCRCPLAALCTTRRDATPCTSGARCSTSRRTRTCASWRASTTIPTSLLEASHSTKYYPSNCPNMMLEL
jgi:Kef-type K+ transport system membrane component KefB